MTASAPIAGTLRTIPDAAPALPPDSGVPTHANFRSVLEHYHASRESDANSDAPQNAREQKQKASDPTATLTVPQPVTTAAEAPRLILPFTTSFTLRQDATVSPDDSSNQNTAPAADPSAASSGTANTSPATASLRSAFDLHSFPAKIDNKKNILRQDATTSPDDASTQNTAAAADPSAASSETVNTSPATASLRSTFDLRSFPAEIDNKPNTFPQNLNTSPEDTSAQNTVAAADPSAASSGTANTSPPTAGLRSTFDLHSFPAEIDNKPKGAHSGTQSKTHAKSQANPQDSVPSQTITTRADLSAPVLPVASSTTLDQAATAVTNSSTVNVAPNTATTSTLDRAVSILATTRNAAYQYHSSHEADPAPVGTSRATQQPQPQKVSDPTAAIIVPVPATETEAPQRLIHVPAASSTPKQDTPAAQSSSAFAPDSSAASATDSKTAMPPAIERADDTTATQPTGSLAFAARLIPTEETPAPAPTPEASRIIDSQTRVQTVLQSAAPATAKQIAAEADLPADTHSGESGSQSDKENRFVKPEMVLPQTHVALQDQTTAAPVSHASASPLTPAARMDQVQEPPATPPSGNHDITLRIPDSNTEQGTAVRFVERAGEVHVSVRTADAEMAQTLRGGLNDLVNRLEDGGIRTQVWQPGTDTSTSQNDSHHPFADPDGSNGRQYSSGSNSEPESKQQNKPRWVEELEGSIGNPNFKETTQLPWQA